MILFLTKRCFGVNFCSGFLFSFQIINYLLSKDFWGFGFIFLEYSVWHQIYWGFFSYDHSGWKSDAHITSRKATFVSKGVTSFICTIFMYLTTYWVSLYLILHESLFFQSSLLFHLYVNNCHNRHHIHISLMHTDVKNHYGLIGYLFLWKFRLSSYYLFQISTVS